MEEGGKQGDEVRGTDREKPSIQSRDEKLSNRWMVAEGAGEGLRERGRG